MAHGVVACEPGMPRSKPWRRASDALACPPPPAEQAGPVTTDYRDRHEALPGRSLRRCPRCHDGSMQTVDHLAAWAGRPGTTPGTSSSTARKASCGCPSTGGASSPILQNARGSGATSVAITHRRDNRRITVSDDGRGIGDPTALLAFGRSGWPKDLHGAEHPAGVGVFSLARRPHRIRSRVAGRAAWSPPSRSTHRTSTSPPGSCTDRPRRSSKQFLRGRSNTNRRLAARFRPRCPNN